MDASMPDGTGTGTGTGALIVGRTPALDRWQWVEADAPLPPHGPLAVPLARWIAERDALRAREDELAVRLEPDDDPARLVPDLDRLAMIAIRFPQFTDGRGYSLARLLRERLGWRGELRAVGDVQRDQLVYLSRVGFDAFALRAEVDVDDAVRAFDAFSDAYQAAWDRPQPLFRRRLGGQGR
jgi:uncharacterized protein (DUF934 family)